MEIGKSSVKDLVSDEVAAELRVTVTCLLARARLKLNNC